MSGYKIITGNKGDKMTNETRTLEERSEWVEMSQDDFRASLKNFRSYCGFDSSGVIGSAYSCYRACVDDYRKTGCGQSIWRALMILRQLSSSAESSKIPKEEYREVMKLGTKHQHFMAP